MKTESMLLVPELAFEENLYSRAEEVVKVLSSFWSDDCRGYVYRWW